MKQNIGGSSHNGQRSYGALLQFRKELTLRVPEAISRMPTLLGQARQQHALLPPEEAMQGTVP